MTASPVTLSRFATYDNSAYPQLWRGCVGAWAPCLGPSGDRLHDYSRRVNWGTLTNMAPDSDWVVSRGAYALDFDGSNDYVDCSGDVAYLNTLTRGTISCWARFATTAAFQCVFGLADSTDANGWVVFYLNGGDGWYWGVYEANTFIANNPFTGAPLPSVGVWQHFALQHTGAAVSLFVNGVRYPLSQSGVGTPDNTAFFSRVSGANSVGWASNIRSSGRYLYYSGMLDDMRLYDRALNSEEIRLLARYRGIAYTPASRVLYAPEDVGGGGGVAKPVLFHSYYMSQGMRP